jgi:Putative transposase/Transposase zinc-binding domain
MRSTKGEVAEVFRTLGSKIENLGFNTHQLRHLSAIKVCRTAALGGHIDACNDCGVVQMSYNSCRNRHCPKCQGHKRTEWMEARKRELLPVPYFHVVFTLPSELNTLSMYEPKAVYDMLFDNAWATLHQFFKTSGVQGGMITILHTWGQNLSLHPHLHCIVPAGGVDQNGVWKNVKGDGKFLFPVKGLSKVFRAKYAADLRARKLIPESETKKLFSKEWVVYAKRPFGSNANVIEYLGRYTHKVAISNHRIQEVNDEGILFEYKDYKTGGDKKTMQLTNEEFTRRFAQHILPHRFVRIRHYGILSSTWKKKKLKDLQHQLKVTILHKPEKTNTYLKRCPCCKKGILLMICTFDKRGPPKDYLMGITPSSC